MTKRPIIDRRGRYRMAEEANDWAAFRYRNVTLAKAEEEQKAREAEIAAVLAELERNKQKEDKP